MTYVATFGPDNKRDGTGDSAAMTTNDEYRAKYLRMLIEKVRDDRYPSTTHMNLIELLIPNGWVPAYLDVLLEKIDDDQNPSTSMLKRIGLLVERVPAETKQRRRED